MQFGFEALCGGDNKKQQVNLSDFIENDWNEKYMAFELHILVLIATYLNINLD